MKTPMRTPEGRVRLFPNRSIDELDLATWRKTLAMNLDSHFLSAKYFLLTMRKEGVIIGFMREQQAINRMGEPGDVTGRSSVF